MTYHVKRFIFGQILPFWQKQPGLSQNVSVVGRMNNTLNIHTPLNSHKNLNVAPLYVIV